jgi:hypothetical protein
MSLACYGIGCNGRSLVWLKPGDGNCTATPLIGALAGTHSTH